MGKQEWNSDLTQFNWAERVESLKAGGIGAIATGIGFAALLLINHQLTSLKPALSSMQTSHPSLSLVIALLSGFLFGITYRYVIRQDQNSHLGDGAVLAFGLVRAGAQVDGQIDLATVSAQAIVLLAIAAESVLLFAIARLVIDRAIAADWLKPFGSQA